MELKYIQNKDLTEEIKTQIIQIKEEHWHYGDTSQRKWLKDNLLANDVHLLGYSGGVLAAYLNAINVNCRFDTYEVNCVGIGNVCVTKDREHTGYGHRLMRAANEFISKAERPGILLCHDNLINFYKKCNWVELHSTNIKIAGKNYHFAVMTFPTFNVTNFEYIEINRNF